MAELIRLRSTQLAAPALLLLALLSPATAAGADNRAPNQDGAEAIEVPAGHKLCFHAYAEGVQIYRWNGTSWAFVAPEAVLYDDCGDGKIVGIHYAGPTWEHKNGGTVVAAVIDRSPSPDPSAIPWLLLGAVTSNGPGILRKVTHIQRVNTVGGIAPASPGTVVGELARVPYAADYFFYRKHK